LRLHAIWVLGIRFAVRYVFLKLIYLGLSNLQYRASNYSFKLISLSKPSLPSQIASLESSWFDVASKPCTRKQLVPVVGYYD